MNLLQEIEQIPMINDHTHIFGCGVPTYEEAGRSAIFDTPEDVLIGLSSMNMNETVFLGKEPQEVRKLLLQLYDGRKTTYPVRAFVRMLHKYFGFEDQEVTLENAPELIRRIREKFPEDTEGYYKCLGELSNTEVYFATTERWKTMMSDHSGALPLVPYIQLNSDKLNEISRVWLAYAYDIRRNGRCSTALYTCCEGWRRCSHQRWCVRVCVRSSLCARS